MTLDLKVTIHTSILTWTNSQNSVAAAGAQSWRYPPMVHLSNDQEDRVDQYENSHKLWYENGHPESDGKLMKTMKTSR